MSFLLSASTFLIVAAVAMANLVDAGLLRLH